MKAGVIRIAQDRRHRGDLFELQENGRQADVAAVENVVHTGEEFGDARVEEVVGVGEDGDLHALPSSGAGASSPSGAWAGSSSGSFSSAGSAASVSLSAPANRPVKRPPLVSVLMKNCSVVG